MPFYRIDLGERQSGWAHLNFGRKAGSSPCTAPAFDFDDPSQFGGRCGRMSTKLCDAPAGTDLGGKALTCDMPLCEQHATHVNDKDLDYCPRHRELAAQLPVH